jgi:hypothetical protein
MVSMFAGSVYVVIATKSGATEYWAAATRREEAAAVQAILEPGWIAALTERRVAVTKIAALKLRPNGVRRLKSDS